MSEWVQENRRAVVMLAVAMCVAVLAGLYLVLSGGASAEDLPPVTQGAPAETAVIEDTAVEEGVIEVRPAVRVYAGRGTSANPFGPIEGGEDGTPSDSDSTAKPTPKPTSTATTPAPRKDPAVSTTRQDPASIDPAPNDPAPKPVDKPDLAPIAPQPIEEGKDSDSSVLVNVVEIDADSLVARIEGQRSRLYLNEPGELGVVYVAPLGGGCAWIGRVESDVRVSVCKAKAERV